MRSNKYTWCSKHIQFTDRKGKKITDKSGRNDSHAGPGMMDGLEVTQIFQEDSTSVTLRGWERVIFLYTFLLLACVSLANNSTWREVFMLYSRAKKIHSTEEKRMTANEHRKKQKNMLPSYSAVHLRKYCQFLSSTTAECIWSINRFWKLHPPPLPLTYCYQSTAPLLDERSFIWMDLSTLICSDSNKPWLKHTVMHCVTTTCAQA